MPAFHRSRRAIQVASILIMAILCGILFTGSTFALPVQSIQSNLKLVPGGGGGESQLGQATTPLQNILSPDGTLNLKNGFSGSLDARGWQMVSNPGMPPRFVRSDAGTRSTDSPSVAGDENWDGTFGTPNVNNYVYAIAVSGTGDVYVGGSFTTAGGATANYIAKWNRDGWSALGVGMNNNVVAIAVSGNGDVYAGGAFTTAGWGGCQPHSQMERQRMVRPWQRHEQQCRSSSSERQW